MKKIILIFIAILSTTTLAVKAQTKKAITKTKQVSTAKAPVKKSSASTPVLQSNNQQNQAKTYSQTEEPIYKTAIGIKFIYGISVTAKHFFDTKNAIEAIVRYNGAAGSGSNIALTGLYEYHGHINSVQGLRWYVGGGGYVNYLSWKDADPVTTFGIAGILGLEYKFKSTPIAVSADWQPGYVISDQIGFSAENGGIGIKYTFK